MMLSSGCTGKHPYASAVRAWRVVRRHKRMFGRRYCRMLDVYRCERCGGWHIGKSFNSPRAALMYDDK